ncbi:MAG: sigma-70 family RNA polymerase sigma factor [Candidatus Nealsonbacteria bacterium]|nr:sigma-70 family RNA polymerase sigma factor [Candidatus Nealsonbacteria bacterium]
MQQDLERIYREHRQGLFSLALSITRCPDLAEDAVHDAMARLWRSSVEPTGDRVAYVFASVRNAALEVGRRRSRSHATQLGTSVFDPHGPDPAESVVEAERRQLARRAVDALPTDQRQVVVLRLHVGLTFQQIADTFGEPLQTVASRYRRALKRIKDSIEKQV